MIEMRRRALESMARGRLQQSQQQSEKKIIVPLNEDSSSGWFHRLCHPEVRVEVHCQPGFQSLGFRSTLSAFGVLFGC